MEKKNYYSIDILKFFCMICVVALHTNPIHDISNTLIISVYYSIVKMAVPCFFLSSGFLIANRLKTNQKYLKTYFLRTINLYIFWNIVYLPLTLYHMLMNGISIKRGILIFIRGFFLIGQQYNSWQLWYLLSTIYSIGIILLIQKYTKLNLNHIILIGIIFYIIDIIITFMIGKNNILQKFLSFLLNDGKLFSGLLYLSVGMWLNSHSLKKIHTYLIIIISFILNIYFKNIPINFVLTAVCAICIFSIVKEIQLDYSTTYITLRKLSAGVYFIHMYVWTFYYMLVFQTKTFGIEAFAFTLILSLLISKLIESKKGKKL